MSSTKIDETDIRRIIFSIIDSTETLDIDTGSIAIYVNKMKYEQSLKSCYTHTSENHGTNHRALASAMLEKTIRTFQPSDQGYTLKGECGKKGALISDDKMLFISFSSDRSDETNAAIAQIGINFYMSIIAKKSK